MLKRSSIIYTGDIRVSEAIDYEKLGRKIAVHLNAQAAEELWSAEDCAKYIKKSQYVFVDRISKHPSFPTPITLPCAKKRRTHPIWYSKEVKAWVAKQR